MVFVQHPTSMKSCGANRFIHII